MPVFFENNKFRYRRSFWSGKHLVFSKVSRTDIPATTAQIEKLGHVFSAIQGMPWPNEEAKNVATLKVYVAFCLTVHGFNEVGQLFMTQDPAIVALTFGTMPD